MHKKILPILLSSILLVGCTTTTPTTIQETSKTIEETTITSETSQETSIETTQETTIETTQFQTSLPYLRHIELDGENIPDGVYFIKLNSIKKDGSSCNCDLSCMQYLLEEDFEYINDNDTIYYNKGMNGFGENNERKGIYQNGTIDNYWSFTKTINNQYVLVENDTNQTCITYNMAQNIDIQLDKNVFIFDGLPFYPYCNYKNFEEEHQRYLNMQYKWDDVKPIIYEDEALQNLKYPNEQELSATFRYRNINDLVFAINNLSLGSGGGQPVLEVVIQDNIIKEIYCNTPLHQPWRFVSIEKRDERDFEYKYINSIEIID